MRLETLQRRMMAAIGGGPRFVEERLYVGGLEAALRGFAVHANTISHARLVALEETFSRTRALLGEARFNALSRAFVETREATAQPHSGIGRHFAAYLEEAGEALAAPLARFEWLWLEAYHAAEAQPLALAEFAALDEATVLATSLARHPATRIAPAGAATALAEEIPSLEGARAILITRPEAEVAINPADETMASLLALLEKPGPIGNLLASRGEQGSEAALAALIALIEAGAVIRAGKENGEC
jgi:hypothetical protein